MALAVLVAAGALLSSTVKANSVLNTMCDQSSPFDGFDFCDGHDRTHGVVEHVNWQAASMDGLEDNTSYPRYSRRSVHLTSKMSLNQGDIAHMPGSDRPTPGEMDSIIEGINTQTVNSIALHNNPQSLMTSFGVDPPSYQLGSCCASRHGCGQVTGHRPSCGDDFNAVSGGFHAMEWTSFPLAVSAPPLYCITQDIVNPEPASWGNSIAGSSPGPTCDMNGNFQSHNIVLDTAFVVSGQEPPGSGMPGVLFKE